MYPSVFLSICLSICFRFSHFGPVGSWRHWRGCCEGLWSTGSSPPTPTLSALHGNLICTSFSGRNGNWMCVGEIEGEGALFIQKYTTKGVHPHLQLIGLSTLHFIFSTTLPVVPTRKLCCYIAACSLSPYLPMLSFTSSHERILGPYPDVGFCLLDYEHGYL